MRSVVAFVAAVGLALLAFWEVALSYPASGWLYLVIGVLFALVFFSREGTTRKRMMRGAAFLVICGILAALFLVPWSTRKPFLRDLARVRVGMMEAEVREIMGRYKEGTGWPVMPGSPTNAPAGTLTDTGSGSSYSVMTSTNGGMGIKDALVFRHSDDGDFNSDWGIVSFTNGRVVRVEFSPD